MRIPHPDSGPLRIARLAPALLLSALCGLAPLTAFAQATGDTDPPRSQLITNVIVMDGSGTAAEPGAVRIEAGLISGIGALEARAGETVVDGGGLVLAPGFIDTHSHADRDLDTERDALASVSQGITTVVIGQDGSGPLPLADYYALLATRPVALNIAAYAAHNSMRAKVMGSDFKRLASTGEVTAMAELLKAELAAGALGLSTGLEYEPGIHSGKEELLALAQVAASAGGRYISHIRSEDRWFWQAVDEIIEIGRTTGMPVQISHVKLAMRGLWGQAPELVRRLDAARAEGIDITADIYPYTYWQSNLMVLIPSRDTEAREEYEYALAEIAPPDGFWLTRFEPEPELVGLTLTEIAARRGLDPVTAFQQLTRESRAWSSKHEGKRADSMIGTSMVEEDIRVLMSWPHTNICSDGYVLDGHPRGAGAFPRVLARYVREQGVLDLPSAIHRMTGLAAAHLGFTDRGRISPGLAADLVLFDPETISDNATAQEPRRLSTGVERVWVNGEVVFAAGRSTGAYPGQILRLTP